MNKELKDQGIDLQKSLSIYPEQYDEVPDPVSIDDMEIDYLPDGKMLTRPLHAPMHENFYENLAGKLDTNELNKIGAYLGDALREDKDSRKQWETKLAKGIELLGITSESKDFPFKGASGAYGPTFLRAHLEFCAMANGELLPSTNIVKSQILGISTQELVETSERVEDWFNYFLTIGAPEYYSDMRQAIFWCGLYGSSFKKTYFDPIKRRPVSPFIAPQDMLINYGANSLFDADRITQIFRLNKRDIVLKQMRGEYIEGDIEDDSRENNDDTIANKIDEIEGNTKPSSSSGRNQRYTLYESHCNLDIDSDHHAPRGLPVPYRVVIELGQRKILALHRNWRQNDSNFNRVNFYSHLKFQTGFGPMGWGFAHTAAEMAQLETSSLRQYKNGMTLANYPGGLRAKGMKFNDNNIDVVPLEFKEIETGGLPIRDVIMPMPYQQPSDGLITLMDKASEAIDRIVGTVSIPINEMNPNVPVGTMLQMIEQASRPQTAIMRQLREAMSNEFMILKDIFYHVMSDQPYPFKVPGKSSHIMKKDFGPDIQIVPTADPNQASSTQRLIKAEAELKTAQASPELHDMRAVYTRYYRALGINDVDEILLPEQKDEDPTPLDPITENQNLMQGKPAKAFIFQEHAAHITVHQDLMQKLAQDQSNQNGPQLLASAQAHIQEHMAMAYSLQMQQAIHHELPEDPSKLSSDEQNQIALAAAQAVQEQQQQQAEQQPQTPVVDQGYAMLEATKVDAENNQMRHMIDQGRLQLDGEKSQNEVQYEMQKLANEAARIENDRMKIELEMEKARFEFEAAQRTAMLKEQELQIKHADNMRDAEIREQEINIRAEGDAFKAQLGYESKTLDSEASRSLLPTE